MNRLCSRSGLRFAIFAFGAGGTRVATTLRKLIAFDGRAHNRHMPFLLAAIRAWGIAVTACLLPASTSFGQPTLLNDVRVVASSTQQVPGVSPDRKYKSFEVPIINDSGQVAFGARTLAPSDPLIPSSLDPPGLFGIWFEGAGKLNLADIEPYRAPPALNSFVFNNQGTIVFADSDGLKLATPGNITTLVARGDPFPNDPENTFAGAGLPSINQSGKVSFLAGSISTGGIWTTTGGTADLVVQTGATVPSSPNAVFQQFYFKAPIDSAGNVTFIDGGLQPGTGVLRTTIDGVYEAPAATNMAVPDLPGVKFYVLRSPTINNVGDIYFRAMLSGTSVTAQNDQSLWRFRNGQLNLVVREGDPAPGVGNAVLFDQLEVDNVPVVTCDTGDAAFKATLRGPGITSLNNTSIWRAHNGNLELVAKADSIVPGFPAGTEFSSLHDPIMNNLGQIAFYSVVQEANGGGTHVGVWAQDATGTLRLVIRDGDTIDIDPGPGIDLHSVADVGLVGSQTDAPCCDPRGAFDRPFGFNDKGQLALQVTFTDSSQAIIVSNLLEVPEPCALALIAVAVVMAVMPRRVANLGRR